MNEPVFTGPSLRALSARDAVAKLKAKDVSAEELLEAALPTAIKDLIMVSGVRTSFGNTALADFILASDFRSLVPAVHTPELTAGSPSGARRVDDKFEELARWLKERIAPGGRCGHQSWTCCNSSSRSSKVSSLFVPN